MDKNSSIQEMKYDPKIFIAFGDIIKQFYDTRLEEWNKVDISSVHIKILHFLVDHEGCNQQVLADGRDVKRSTMSADLDKMEKNGLIYREKSEKDKRMTNIFLTEKGHEIGNIVKTEYRDYCFENMKDFSQEELDMFFKCMEKFTKNSK